MLNNEGMDLLFLKARSHVAWHSRTVPEETLRQLYDLVKMGPTSINCSPLRIVFVHTPAARDRLKSCVNEGNVDKTMSAPVTAVLGYDETFYEFLPRLFPYSDVKSGFAKNAERAKRTASLNATLQAGYFIMAARSLGLDCGPIGGFSPEKTDALFFPDGRIRSFLLCNIGYGDETRLRPRGERLAFEEVCRID